MFDKLKHVIRTEWLGAECLTAKGVPRNATHFPHSSSHFVRPVDLCARLIIPVYGQQYSPGVACSWNPFPPQRRDGFGSITRCVLVYSPTGSGHQNLMCLVAITGHQPQLRNQSGRQLSTHALRIS